MKTFKQFIVEAAKIHTLSWESSFGEVRTKRNNEKPKSVKWSAVTKQENNKKPISVLSWSSDFGSNRKNLPKDIHESNSTGHDWHQHDSELGYSISPVKKDISDPPAYFNGAIHLHYNVMANNLSDEHKEAIKNYCSGSPRGKMGYAASSSMNKHLRKLAGEPVKESVFSKPHDPALIQHAINTLSSAFTPENTNRMAITTYAGVPNRIGKKFEESEKGSRHVLTGFTSTSTNRSTAHSFTKGYDFDTKDRHVLQLHVEPGAGLSVAEHSPYSENEVLINHNTPVTYHHTELHPNADGTITHVHHITVHAKQ